MGARDLKSVARLKKCCLLEEALRHSFWKKRCVVRFTALFLSVTVRACATVFSLEF